MPARNGMGPRGLGPLTGRGMGECGGRAGAGFAGRGMGRGFGGFGRGPGRGFGPGYGAGYGAFSGARAVSDVEARDELLARKAAIDAALASVEARLKAGEGSKGE